MTYYIFTPHGHHFHCTEPGASCIAPHMKEEGRFFIHPQLKEEMQDDVHDEVLFELTDKLNELVYQTAQKRNDKNLRIVITSKGLVWMWTEKINHDTETDSKELDDNALLEILGLNQSAS